TLDRRSATAAPASARRAPRRRAPPRAPRTTTPPPRTARRIGCSPPVGSPARAPSTRASLPPPSQPQRLLDEGEHARVVDGPFEPLRARAARHQNDVAAAVRLAARRLAYARQLVKVVAEH